MTFPTITKEFVLEWSSTVVLLVGVLLTSFNIYPANLYVLTVGNFAWVALAVMWRKWSLFTVQIIITIIYLLGLVNLFI